MAYPFDSGKDWSFAEIDQVYELIRDIAERNYQLTYYPNQIEIITSEQMLDAYSSVGVPVYYNHWSFGKQFVSEQEAYKRGQMGLAYEIVINSNPCVSYLMEENTMMMQSLVIAHACFGHNSFFKNNVHFQQWTDASAILDYLTFAKNYIKDCEEKYGALEVERVLDAAHALQQHGVDRYKRPSKLSKAKQEALEAERRETEERQFNDLWRTIPVVLSVTGETDEERERFPKHPDENILYFLEKHAPNLESWKREILRIVRKIAQYFYPQMLTKIMNEGFATFFHHAIMMDLHKEKHVTDGFMLEFLHSHSGVIRQPAMRQINPYALGFAMFQDIKRIAEDPTDEDRRWFPDWAGKGDWLAQVKYAAYNFKDESFILQYLSPKIIRDFQLFYIRDDDKERELHVEAIHNDEGYRLIREKLAEQQNANNHIPNIQVVDVDIWNDRSLTLEHTVTNGRLLDESSTKEVLRHVKYLWGRSYRVTLKSVDSQTNLVMDSMTV